MKALTAVSWFILFSAVERTVQAATIPETGSHSKGQSPEANRSSEAVINGQEDQTKAVSKKSDEGFEKDAEPYRKFSGIRYTPLDLAEYILRTRDEEGVALAIEELLNEGLIDKKEAISYLVSVKRELKNLKEQGLPYKKQKANTFETDNQSTEKRVSNSEHQRQQQHYYEQEQDSAQQTESAPKAIKPDDASPIAPHKSKENRPPTLKAMPNKPKEAPTTKNSSSAVAPSRVIHHEGGTEEMPVKKESKPRLPKPLEKAKAADSLYEEYLLENVIYELAKDMFSQSMARDDASTEQLLSRFASFLETELADKKFSKESQEKILDTVSAALIESLRERLYLQN